MSKAVVKTTFEASRTIRPIYTGGSISLDASGRILLSCIGEDALIVDLETGDQLTSLEGDGEIITSLAITPSASHAVVCSRSMSMRIYALSSFDATSQSINADLVRTLKPHPAPVVTTAIDPTGTLLATGAADGSIKVWDIRGGYVTHTFNDRGVISALCFFEASADSEAKSSSKKKSKRKTTDEEDEDMNDANADPTIGFRLACGSDEGKVRVFDLHKRKSIASLDSHVSLVRSLSFSPSENALLSASRDKTLIIWDAKTWKQRRIIPVLESVEAATFIGDSGLCVIGGEHAKLRLWDCNRGSEVTEEQEAGEEYETIVGIEYSPGLPFVMTVHADQTIRLHSLESLSGYTPGSTIEPLQITRRISGNDDEIIDLAFVGQDRSMLALATNTETIRIVSVAPSDDRPSTGTEDFFGADIAHLEGHEDIIMAIDVDWSGHWLATAGKDNTARLWRIDPKESSYTCFAIFTGHAETLGAIALPRVPPPAGSSAYNDPLNHPPAFIMTASSDRTIKRWDTAKLGPAKDGKPHSPKAIFTRKAHEKDINALDIDSSNSLFASASQDRTVKIWDADEGSPIGLLRGHKRGVWSVRFAPKGTPIINTDAGTSTSRGLVATGSGDKTIKLWSLSDYSCLMTFEGHVNSVLKVMWLPPSQISKSQSADDEDDDETAAIKNAIQMKPLIASAAADGLVKIWGTHGECEATLDNHEDRVWALATPTPSGSRSDTKTTSSKQNSTPFALASGAADSTVTLWTDTTSATYTAAVNATSERVEQDQQLQNYIRAGAYREAITLALQLNHPGRLLSLFSSAIDAADDPTLPEEERERAVGSLTGNPSIDEVLQSLDSANLRTLLLRLRDWNTNARNSRVAQRILYALFRSYPASTFVELATQSVRGGKDGRVAAGLKDILAALASYTERHYKRVEELSDDSYLVEWVLGEMDGGVGLGGMMSLDLGEDGINGGVEEHEKDIIMLEG